MDEEELRAREAMRAAMRRARRAACWLGLFFCVFLAAIEFALRSGARAAALWIPMAVYAACFVELERRGARKLALACALVAAATAYGVPRAAVIGARGRRARQFSGRTPAPPVHGIIGSRGFWNEA